MKAIIKVICNALERDNTSIRAEMAEQLKKDFADYEQENKRLREALNTVSKIIHYPDCWDTMAYPTVEEALHEYAVHVCPTCGER